MKIILNSKSLLEKLQYLNGIIPSNPTLPILGCFLFEVVENNLKITASDLENTITSTVPIENQLDLIGNDIKIAIDSRIFIELLKAFPHQPITLTVLKNNTIEITAASGNYTVAYDSGESFPTAPEVETESTLTLPSKVLSKAISKTVFATGNDDLRPIMNGVLFQLNFQGINFVATDAHKLVKYTRTDVTATREADFIIPKKPLNVLKSIPGDEEVTIEYNSINAKFTFGDYVLITRLIDGKYPNYEAVIPKDNPNKLTIDRQQFHNSVKCVSIFSNKNSHQIRLKLAGTELRISAEDADYSNKADERLTCSYQGNDIQIGFNSRFLSEMLGNLNSNEIQFETSVPNRAGILTPIDGLDEGENILMLIMPSLLT